ncbi:MAG: ion channel [Rhodobacter sp.]|nr:ion channel [Rhodobacter sp.]
MVVQLALGTLLIVVSTLIAGGGFLAMERMLNRYESWMLRPPHARKLIFLMCAAVVWVLMIVTASVWIWALTFLWLDVFITLEASVYFSIVAFTTLGFGDILLPSDWRLLAGMTAINGLLMIGLQTAILVEVLRRVRAVQAAGRDASS